VAKLHIVLSDEVIATQQAMPQVLLLVLPFILKNHKS